MAGTGHYRIFTRLFASMAYVVSLCGCIMGGTITDIDMEVNSDTHRSILTAAQNIRKRIGQQDKNLTKERLLVAARDEYLAALAAWRNSVFSQSGYAFDSYKQFETSPVKLFDAYVAFLNRKKNSAEAISVLQTAVAEAEKSKNYRIAVGYRIALAEKLAGVGQLENARAVLDGARGILVKLYGRFGTPRGKEDPFNVALNAHLLSAYIHSGEKLNREQLQAFFDVFDKALSKAPAARFIAPETESIDIILYGHKMDDDKYYRRDQEYWATFAVAAIKAGDRQLAQRFLENLKESGQRASSNQFAEDNEWRGDYARQAQVYMSRFYLSPKSLRGEKFSDTAFGLETAFDSAIAEAEINQMLGNFPESVRVMTRAEKVLPELARFSDELIKLGHTGFNVEMKQAQLNRIAARALIRSNNPDPAIEKIDAYIRWSERHRESLSLEERLPYFRSQAQGVYLDAVLAHALRFQNRSSADRFFATITAIEATRARHLKDALGTSRTLAASVSPEAGLKRLTAAGQSLLTIADTGEHLVVAFTDGQHHQLRLVEKPHDFDAGVMVLRNDLAERHHFDAVRARQLTVQVLGGLESAVFGARQLAVSVDGALSFLPVELWLDRNNSALGSSTAVSYLPSLTLIGAPRQNSPGTGVLALGDPQFNQAVQIASLGADAVNITRSKRSLAGFTPLPETRDEVMAVLSTLKGDGKVVVGKDATINRLRREKPESFRYLHFATHGVVGGEVPGILEPALVLTPEGSDGGFLTTSEIARMKVNADLVVLSACNTGNGEYFNGEGLMGLGRAFIVAGAKAVVVSLWPVDSNTTKDLMVRFYRELSLTSNASTALANARKAIMNSDRSKNNELRGLAVKNKNNSTDHFHGRGNPFYWAPFIVVETGI